MDELEISGKRYISTRRAAREHGYHSDYMGQLIRGKKVAGQKVGRAWYIEEDSLNIYLGKALAPAPAPAPVADVVSPAAPAPVERLIIEEPVPAVVPEPQLVAEVAAPEPAPVSEPIAEVAEEIYEEAQPIAVRIHPQTIEPVYEPAVQKIHHAPYIEEQETRIPVHIPSSAMQQAGGLRYAADDSPSMPVVTRMPQTYAQAYAPQHAPAPRQSGTFPYVSLCVVAVVAVLAATFASNFVSATIVSEQGKSATVQYAIHW
jgi:hypothetical protein